MGTPNEMKMKEIPIDLNTIENIKNFGLVYHEEEDTLFLRPGKPRAATSLDWGGEIWIRIDPVNGEVVGLEVDDFETLFLKKHPEIANAWEESKPLCHRKRRPKEYEGASWESFIQIVVNFLLEFLRANPKQASLSLSPSIV